MQIHRAIIDNASKIQAALNTAEMKAASGMLRAAGVPKITEPLKLSALDEHLKCSRLSVAERIALKSAMSRAGLLIN